MVRSILILLILSSAPACGDDDGASPVDAGPDDAASPAVDSGPTPPPPEELDAYVRYYMARAGVLGLATIVVDRDGTLWSSNYGLADAETGRVVDDETLFSVASISKTVTNLAVLQLVEDGTIDLDAPVEDLLPFSVRNPAFPSTPITARGFLTHTSGLRDDFVWLVRTQSEGDSTITLSEFVQGYTTPGGAFFSATNWGPETGTSHDYCNAGFAVAGLLVEIAGGRSLAAHARERIFTPLGMDASGFLLSEIDDARLAVGYTYNGTVNRPVPRTGFAYYPASSLRTSAHELGRLIRATMRDGELDGARVLDATLAADMREVQVPALSPSRALTWQYRTFAGERFLHHGGSTFEGSAIAAFSVELNVGFAVLANSDAFIAAQAGLEGPAQELRRIVERIAAEAVALAP